MILRKTHRISWMISGWIRPDTLGPENGGTACLTLGCPGDFYAVRLGFANVTANPWTITKVIGRASSSFGDYVNPTGEGAWTPFTFAMQGRDDDRIVTRADAPTVITVAGNSEDPATGETANPAWTWTDWVPLKGDVPDPRTGMRVLMLRALVPPEQTVCVAHGQLRALTGNYALNKGFDYFVGGLKRNRDRVTAPVGPENAVAWEHNGLANGSSIPIVQFMTALPGIVGIGTGDSHHQGTSTTAQFTSFLYRSMTRIGRERFGKTPVGMVNCAGGGLTSEQFFQRLEVLLGAVRPSFAVLPGWTFNDRTRGAPADSVAMERFLARAIRSAETCLAHGVTPIFLTPFPRNRDMMTPTQLAPWRRLRQTFFAMSRAGVVVFDATPLLGNERNGAFDGTYMESRTIDHMHPDDRGHDALAAAFGNLIAAALDGRPAATRGRPERSKREARSA
jgi:hypothetical protein